MSETTLVKYVQNADHTVSTAAISMGDDRPNIAIGGVGYVTDEELHRLVGFGAVLEPISEEDAIAEGLLQAPEEAAVAEVSLNDLDNKGLRAVAEDEGVDVAGLKSNPDIAAAITKARAGVTTGPASLPAMASANPPAPAPNAASSGTASTSASASESGSAS